MKKIKSVCVYCASSSQVPEIYFSAAQELGKLLANQEIKCIYGAGNQGLMGTLANSVLASGGEVTGIIPRFMYEEGWAHKKLTQIKITENMHERKQTMAALSDAVIAMPGGCGTMEELLEIITWKQLGLYMNPIVILNINKYYDPLIELLNKAISQSFMRTEHARMWEIANTPKEAISALYKAYEWTGSVRKFAAI